MSNLLSFEQLPLREALQKPQFVFADFAKFTTPDVLHVGMQALHSYRRTHEGALPRPWNKPDSDEFLQICQKFKAPDQQLDEHLLKALSYTASGELGPISAFLGGFAAQECMKSLTGKFTPLNQWFYYDAIEVLPREILSTDDLDTSGLFSKRSAAQIIVLGKTVCRHLENLRLFTVYFNPNHCPFHPPKPKIVGP